MSNNHVKSSHRFGFWTLTFLVVANMVGAGVFTTSGFSMGSLHSPTLVVAAWVVGGIIAMAGAISYGQLIRRMPESGGEYLFLSRGIHPSVGFVAGWVSLIAGFTGAIAFAAKTFAIYAVPLILAVPFLGITEETNWVKENTVFIHAVVAIGVIVLAAFLHGIKVNLGVRGQNIAVILKLVLLVLFLVVAASRLSTIEAKVDLPPVVGSELWGAFCQSLVYISLSYLGFNAAVYVADEVAHATKTIPRSLICGTALVVLMYVLLNIVFVYSANASEVAGSFGDVAAFSAEKLGGDRFAFFFRIIISIALFTSVTSMMMAAPRVYAKMADDGLLPGLFRFQNETPLNAIVLQVLLASSIVFWSTLEQLLGYLGVTLSLCAAASVSCLFFVRPPEDSENPNRFRFASRWHMIPPAFYVLTTLFVVALSCYHMENGSWQLLAAIGTFACGAIYYFLKPDRVKKTF